MTDVIVQIEEQHLLVSSAAQHGWHAEGVALVPVQHAEKLRAESLRSQLHGGTAPARPAQCVGVIGRTGAHGEHALYRVEKQLHIRTAPEFGLAVFLCYSVQLSDTG